MTRQAGLSWWEDRFWDEVDAVIVGAGIVGLLTALRLKQQKPSYRVVVLDRDPLALGASSRNAGFACFGSITELKEDIRDQGWDAAMSLAERRYRGLQTLRSLTGDDAIGLRLCGSREVFLETESAVFCDALDMLPDINRAVEGFTGMADTFRPAHHAPSGMKLLRSSLLNVCEGILETHLLLQNLRRMAQEKGVEIFGGFAVETHERISSGFILRSGRYGIKARLLAYCTNAFTPEFFPELSIVPARGQVLVSSPLAIPLPDEAFFYDKGYTYFRPLDGNRLLIGGFRNLDVAGEETYNMETGGPVWRALEAFVREIILPGRSWEVAYAWAGTMAMGAERGPVVREMEPGVVVCARMSGMGVALSANVSLEATELLLRQ